MGIASRSIAIFGLLAGAWTANAQTTEVPACAATSSCEPQKVKPKGNQGYWVGIVTDSGGQAAYSEARVAVTLTVNENGRVSQCEVTEPSAFPRFDSEVCRLLTSRARFYPATDKNGQPVTASWSTSVRNPKVEE